MGNLGKIEGIEEGDGVEKKISEVVSLEKQMADMSRV